MRYVVNRCIYCGAQDRLTDEHVLPLSLGGRLILGGGSCQECAKVTTRFEDAVCRQMFGGARSKFGFPTRHKNRRHREVPVTYLHADGTEEVVFDTPARQPSWYVAIDLPPPGIVFGDVPTDGREPFKASFILHDGVRQESRGGPGLRATSVISVNALYRLLAKVAHGLIFYKCGTTGYRPLMPAVVLGGDARPWHWIGGLSPAEIPPLGGGRWFDMFMATLRDRDYLVVRVQLPFRHVPTYQVVAGVVQDRPALEAMFGRGQQTA